MAFEAVFGYRIRFDASSGRSTVTVHHSNGSSVTSTDLNDLPPAGLAALTTLLKLDKDHKIAFDPDTRVFDAGPEKP